MACWVWVTGSGACRRCVGVPAPPASRPLRRGPAAVPPQPVARPPGWSWRCSGRVRPGSRRCCRCAGRRTFRRRPRRSPAAPRRPPTAVADTTAWRRRPVRRAPVRSRARAARRATATGSRTGGARSGTSAASDQARAGPVIGAGAAARRATAGWRCRRRDRAATRSAAPIAAVTAGRVVVTTGTRRCSDIVVVTTGIAAPPPIDGHRGQVGGTDPGTGHGVLHDGHQVRSAGGARCRRVRRGSAGHHRGSRAARRERPSP